MKASFGRLGQTMIVGKHGLTGVRAPFLSGQGIAKRVEDLCAVSPPPGQDLGPNQGLALVSVLGQGAAGTSNTGLRAATLGQDLSPNQGLGDASAGKHASQECLPGHGAVGGGPSRDGSLHDHLGLDPDENRRLLQIGLPPSDYRVRQVRAVVADGTYRNPQPPCHRPQGFRSGVHLER